MSRKKVYDGLSSRFHFFTKGTIMDLREIAEKAARLSNEYKQDLPESESFENECLPSKCFIQRF